LQLGALWDEAESAAADGGGFGSGSICGGSGSAAGACLGSSSLARRLAIKLAQRVGLTLLAPRLARWRYVRQKATLLGGAAAGGLEDLSSNSNGDDPAAAHAADGGADDFIDVVEEVEEVLGCLLAGLRDRDTAVRWTASKGVARLTGCLPAQLGADVIDSVMALFGPAGEGGGGGGGGERRGLWGCPAV